MSSDEPAAITVPQETLPPPELAELRTLSQHSNYSSVSSTASCEDIRAIQSPEHVPLPNGSHDALEVKEFPSVGIPAGQKLQSDTSLTLSASDIFVDTNNSASSIKSPSIFVGIFDPESDKQNRDSVVSPTAELCAPRNNAMDEIVLDASTNQIISKLESSTAAAAKAVIGPADIDILSQEILNEISMVGMSLNEEQFMALPDECSPKIKHKQTFDKPSSDQPTVSQQHAHNSGLQHKQHSHVDRNIRNGLDKFPRALPRKDTESSRFLMENMKSSSISKQHRYPDGHHHKMTVASNIAADDAAHYHVHISPYTSDNDSPKATKRNYSNNVSSHPLHTSRESPKSSRQKHHSSPASMVDRYWRDISPQYSDEPNEEFVLPPPPQFQTDNSNSTSSNAAPKHVSSSTTEPISTHVDVDYQSQKVLQPSVSSSSSLRYHDSVEKPSVSTSKQNKTLKGGRTNMSASHIMNMGNMDEEVLLTDMLKSLDQMAAQRYQEEMQHKEKHGYTPESKAEKSEKKRHKKKIDKKRRSTVGIFSFDDLLKQSVQEDCPVRAEEYPQQPTSVNELKASDDSKVKKLAREYSKRVKDRQVFSIKKRFSVHSYENFSGSESSTPELKQREPSWKAAADTKRESSRAPQPVSPVGRRLPTILSGSSDIGVSAKGSDIPDCTIVSNNYVSQPSPKATKFRSSPVIVRSSSPVRLRIEGYEKLSQPRDDYPAARKSESANPIVRSKTLSGAVSHVKSHENLHVIDSSSHQSTSDRENRLADGLGLGPQSRELSKSYGSLNPAGSNSMNGKSYRGLSVFSPDSVNESNVVYKPPGGSYHRDEFEHMRNKGGFKGWVKNLVDKFSK